jgi:hypothetical protein
MSLYILLKGERIMAKNERGFGVNQSAAELEEYKRKADEDPKLRDWDPIPRPVPFSAETEEIARYGSVACGEIALNPSEEESDS